LKYEHHIIGNKLYRDFVDLLEKSGQDYEVLYDIGEYIARNFNKMN